MGEVARVDNIIDYIVLTAGYVLWHIAGVILSTGLLPPTLALAAATTFSQPRALQYRPATACKARENCGFQPGRGWEEGAEGCTRGHTVKVSSAKGGEGLGALQASDSLQGQGKS